MIYGSGGGRGDPGHLTMEYFRMRAGFEGVHVPYKGNSQVVMNLVGGQIHAGFLATPGVLPHITGWAPESACTQDGGFRAASHDRLKRVASQPRLQIG